MSPNPYILLRNLVNPARWFSKRSLPLEKAKARIEHWDEPVPGLYEYIPGRGWLLIAIDSDNGDKLDKPISVTYSRILHRYLLTPEFESRKKWGTVKDENGIAKKGVLFRLDDAVTWVFCWNEIGEFDKSERRVAYCIDAETNKFRLMTAADRRLEGQATGSRTGSIAPQSLVGSDMHKASQPRNSHPSTHPSTCPSTRPSTRPSSSHGSGLRKERTASSMSTPPSLQEPEFSEFNVRELDKKLQGLGEE